MRESKDAMRKREMTMCLCALSSSVPRSLVIPCSFRAGKHAHAEGPSRFGLLLAQGVLDQVAKSKIVLQLRVRHLRSCARPRHSELDQSQRAHPPPSQGCPCARARGTGRRGASTLNKRYTRNRRDKQKSKTHTGGANLSSPNHKP
jgi:hypothetical protein